MFEIDRVQSKQIGKIFKSLYVDEYKTVKQVFEDSILQLNSELIVFKIDSKYLAFSKYLMAYHHIAQGYVNKKPYMLTFCAVCNTGMIMNPVVDNKMFHFHVAGSYNGMVLMSDNETNTYWDHITGLGLYGKHEGQQLEIIQSHQILSTKEVLEIHPNCLYGVAKMNFFQKLFAKFQNWKSNRLGNGFLPPGFRKSMTTIDSRLPEMERGLGVWIDKKAKFYPLKLLKENENYFIDIFNNQTLLIYISPVTKTPTVIYAEDIKTVSFSKNKIILNDNNYLLSGNLYSHSGKKLTLNSPNHVFSRWYGFVSTFSDCEVKTNANK